MLHVTPDGETQELPLGNVGTTETVDIALGPGGRVYLATGSVLVATCRGSVLWTAKFDGSGRAFVGPRVAVEQSGSVWITGGDAERSVRFGTGGEIEESRPSVPPSTRPFLLAHGRVHLWRHFEAVTDETWAEVVSVGLTYQLANRPTPTTYHLAGDDSVWARSRRGPGDISVTRFDGQREAWTRTDIPFADSSWAAAADGSLLVHDGEGGIVRVGPDGETLWRLPLFEDGESVIMPFAGPFNAFTLDSTGVLYTTVNQGFNNYVVAVQTDALPAVGGATCRNVGCTPARDSWAR